MKNEDPSIAEQVTLLFENTPELYDGELPEAYDDEDEFDDLDASRQLPLDAHLALQAYAYATRREKARIYAKFKNIRLRLKH